MIFNSLAYLIFFAVVLSVYYLLADRQKKIFLLLASYFFYMWWNPYYIFLILISTATDYFAALQITKTTNRRKKTFFLILSIVVNLGILSFFKYGNFFIKNYNRFLGGDLHLLDVLLPVGISFYTFQTMGYTIDVYKNKIKPEKNFLNFALFVVFFPQLVAGPIERAGRLLSQIRNKIKINSQQIEKGLILIIWGFFLKVVVADNLAVYTDVIFYSPQNFKGLSSLTGALFFAFQIYCDFAGYTNIAIGTAMMLGFKLMDNFKQPYFAVSFKDFWHRWHISLSTWFRDYIYIPLGGKRVSFPKWIIIIFVTFVLSGFWHGASWTFLIWGFLHALLFVSEEILRRILPLKIKRLLTKHLILNLRRLVVFGIGLLLWIIFRSLSVKSALLYLRNLFIPDLYLNFDHKTLIINILLIISVLIADRLELKQRINDLLLKLNPFLKFSILYLLLLAVFFIGNWHLRQFIYFRF